MFVGSRFKIYLFAKFYVISLDSVLSPEDFFFFFFAVDWDLNILKYLAYALKNTRKKPWDLITGSEKVYLVSSSQIKYKIL